MTIKEVEARTGLTRANIRYYEGEGFSAWASPSAAPYGPWRSWPRFSICKSGGQRGTMWWECATHSPSGSCRSGFDTGEVKTPTLFEGGS